MSLVLALLSLCVCRPLRALLLAGLRWIHPPSSPLAIINGSDPCTPSATAPPPLDLLHVALMSHLSDEIGWHEGMRTHHNSTTRHNSPDAINRLCKASLDGTCPEATPFIGKEAPQWP